MSNFHLEPLAYFSTPGFAFDAALKFSGVKLELMDNEAMYGMIEHGIRGGVSQIVRREAVGNNEYMEDYKADEPLVHLVYRDCTNLYGKVMIDKLPTRGFKWVEADEWGKLMNLDIWTNLYHMTNIELEGEDGYIVEVDLRIPEGIHDLTNDMPLAPEELIVKKTMLSPFQENFPENAKKDSKKLAPTCSRRRITLYMQEIFVSMRR